MKGRAINEKSGRREIIRSMAIAFLFLTVCLPILTYLFGFCLVRPTLPFLLTPMDKTVYTQGQQETLLATEQENTDITRKNIESEALLEERKEEIKKIKDESAEFKRQLEVALLLSAQQGLANLDMQTSFTIGLTRHRHAMPVQSLGLHSLVVASLDGVAFVVPHYTGGLKDGMSRGSMMNHDKCRGSCFCDAPNGLPIPLCHSPFSNLHPRFPCQASLNRPTSLWKGEGREVTAAVVVKT